MSGTMISIPKPADLQPLQLVLGFCLVILLSLCTFLFVDSKSAGLSHIPGPFVARYTSLWGVYVAWRTSRDDSRVEYFRGLQRCYGDVFRSGPKHVTVLDPAAIPAIYGVRSRLDKGEAYIPFRQNGVTTSLLSIPDEATHSKYRKLVSNAYSLSSITHYEPYMEEMTARLVEVCDEHARTGASMNLSLWYAFDVVSKVTLGQPLGFLEAGGRDAFSLIKRVRAFGFYTTLVSQMPWLHKVLSDNFLMRSTKPSPFMGAVRRTVDSRLDKADEEGRPDLLAHFAATHRTNPDMNRFQVLITTSGNLIAGGLSPGKTFNEICYFLAREPQAQDKLLKELQQAQCTGSAVPYSRLQKLGYLEGVVKEGVRLHNGTILNLQRVTGSEGLELPNGVRIPPRTCIGCASSAIQQDARVFGEDASVYKPERWQQGKDETEEAYIERRKVMDRSELMFGHGSRTCIGKNIALMEMFKAVATLVGEFKFEAVGTPSKDKVVVTVQRREKV